jgi:hypothetical protein
MPEAAAQAQVKFESWAIIELMGHQQIAGFVTEATIAGGAFIRVDVPNSQGEGDLYTRYLGTSSIYAINPTTKQEVLAFVNMLTPKPPTPRTSPYRQLAAGFDPEGQDFAEGDDEESDDQDEDDKPW